MIESTNRLGITGREARKGQPKTESISHSQRSLKSSEHYHAKIVGQDIRKVKELNPQADQSSPRPGLTESSWMGTGA